MCTFFNSISRKYIENAFNHKLLSQINLIFITTVIIVLGLADRIIATNWYLDLNANGKNSGSSWVDAWNNPNYITQTYLMPGDILYVQGGNYNNGLGLSNRNAVTVRVADNATTPAVFNWLHIYNCDGIIIDGLINNIPMLHFVGSEPSVGHAVNIRRSMPVTVKGILIDRKIEYSKDIKQQHGVRIWDQSGKVLIEKCTIKNTTGDGINITQVDYTGISSGEYDWIDINECMITNTGDDGIQSAVPNVTIRNNVINKNSFPTYFGGHPDGFQLNPDMYNVKIYNNNIGGFNQNIFIEYTTGEIYIYNNLLSSTSKSGTDRGVNCSYRGTTPYSGVFLIANNVFYNFLNFHAINGGLPESSIIANNIFLNCKLISSFDIPKYLDFSNIYFDNPDVQYFDTNGIPVITVSNRYSGNSLFEDPKFASLESFKLLSGSPAIGKGRNMNRFFTSDRDGIIWGESWNSGFYKTIGNQASPRNLRIIQ